jgi:hypothetical protein
MSPRRSAAPTLKAIFHIIPHYRVPPEDILIDWNNYNPTIVNLNIEGKLIQGPPSFLSLSFVTFHSEKTHLTICGYRVSFRRSLNSGSLSISLIA